jgi:5-methylcytosine-specific restriction endonuclease McrA
MAVLLLNASLQPLNVISHRRLVVLLTKERVAFLDADAEVRAAAALQDRRIPEDVVMVRLLRNIHVPRRVLRPNRRNLLLRDDNTCQYCGMVAVPAELTVDHVVPVSRGGAPDRWDNVVLACKRCNWRKADRLPAEVGMHLLRAPGPLTQEYAHIIFLRYPALKAAYDAFCATAAA